MFFIQLRAVSYILERLHGALVGIKAAQFYAKQFVQFRFFIAKRISVFFQFLFYIFSLFVGQPRIVEREDNVIAGYPRTKDEVGVNKAVTPQ